MRGDPTPDELAALLAVVTSRAAPAPGTAAPSDASGWGVRRDPLAPGPGAWRASAREPGVRTRASW